jgi:hypothetical protein
MFIFDWIGKTGKLWKLENSTARESKFSFSSMRFKSKPFMIVAINDPLGFGENTLPLLLNLVDGFKPVYRNWNHSGVGTYFKETKSSKA